MEAEALPLGTCIVRVKGAAVQLLLLFSSTKLLLGSTSMTIQSCHCKCPEVC